MELFLTLAMNIYKSYLVKEHIYSDSNRASIHLSNTFFNLYLRPDDFPKNYVKFVALFCPPGISIVNLRYSFVVEQNFLSIYFFFFRNRMTLNSSQAFYLLVEDKGIASMSMTLAELYEKKKDKDGFLYMSYASQGFF